MFSKFILFLFIFFISSCATNEVRVKDVNKPIKLIQSSVFRALPNGKPKVDKSKRKFISKPFLSKAGIFIPVSNSRVYYIASVEILGDRRPYTIFIESLKMVKNGQQYIMSGKSKTISGQVAKAILEELSKRLETSDMIDDFRAF